MTQSNSQTHRLIAIGDIHGCIRPLEAIIETLQPTPHDVFVILGDIVNRGPASRQVIEKLIDLRRLTQLVFILGNHEEEMLAARDDEASLARWLSMGGHETLASYGDDVGIHGIPSEHWDFLESAIPWWQTEQYCFTHANYDPELPFDIQSGARLRWLSLQDSPPKPHYSGKTVIVGHTPNLNGTVVDFGFLRCLDTGCGLGGRLTAMDIRHRHIWQCAEVSDVVVWHD